MVGTSLTAQTDPGPGVTSSAKVQEPTQEELMARRTVVMAAPVFTRAPWLFDYEAARAAAKAKGQLIFVYCTRSYRPEVGGRQLEAGSFSEPAFVEFAKSVVLLCNITSHVEGDKDQGLLQELEGRAFPHLVFLDADGEVFCKVPAGEEERVVARFVELRGKAEAARALAARFRAGEKAVARELLMARYSLNAISFKDATELASEIHADAEQRKQIDQALLQIEVQELSGSARLVSEVAVVGRRFDAMWKQGRVPTGVPARNFFSMILTAKDVDGDVEGFGKALDAYRDVVKGLDRAEVIVKGYEAQLARLKKRVGEPAKVPPSGK